MWRFSGLLLGALLLGTVIFWRVKAGASPGDAEPPDPPPAPVVAEKSPEPSPARPTGAKPSPELSSPARVLPDPVVVAPCNLLPIREQEISSQVDSVLREIRVRLGDHVRAGQVLGRLDDRQLRPQVELLQIKANSRAAERIARAQRDEADSKVQYAVKANRSGYKSVSDLDYRGYLLQRERFAQEMKKAREERQAAGKELERARQQLEQHTLRSGLTGEVVKVCKRDGEAVRQAEPLFRVADYDRLRVEAFCKVQQADLLRPGMRALLEPELRGEQLTQFTGHTAPVAGLAVSPDGRLVASASEDRTVMLWAWPGGMRRAVLPHPAEVYAVAFGRRRTGAGFRLLTGGGDGRARLWTVTASAKVQGPTVLPDRHTGALRAVAISADGRRAATAGEDKRVAVWDLDAGKRLFWVGAGDETLAPAHQGAVTAVHFTPDGGLVTAGRDNTLKVWRLGKSGATLAAEYRGRTGDAAQLGVSPDGRRLLFDHGDELRILNSADGALLGSLRNQRHGRFQALAIFSPSGRLVLSGSNNGRLQLWKAPAARNQAAFLRGAAAHGFRPASLLALGGLGAGPLQAAASSRAAVGDDPRLPRLWGLDGREVRYFLNPGAATVLCGAFAPDESVCFTGGTDKLVRAWALPPARQWARPLEAEITYVGSQVERGTDLVRIRAEVDNPSDPARRLRPGTYASLRVYPETAPGQ
jgi:WD40 repeat protein/biotin carboxyl carrier protein